MVGVSMESSGPKYWISSGSFLINKIMSGKYMQGLPQGRLACLCGPSGAGKSFMVGNFTKSAQNQDVGILVVDSEKALDDEYMTKIGVNVNDPYYVYRSTNTLDGCTKIVSNFIKSYRKHEQTKKFIIIIDSLDMLSTESVTSSYADNGELRADMGLHAKQSKQMLIQFMHSIADLPISILCTKQVYKTQDSIKQKNPATEYEMTESAMFPFSQVIQLTRLMKKDDATKQYDGIVMKAFGKKTRFTKPFQWARIEVPYDTGMDEFSGVLDAAKNLGIVQLNGAWYSFNNEKFQSKNFDKYKNDVLNAMIALESKSLYVTIEDEEEVPTETKASDIAKVRMNKSDE